FWAHFGSGTARRVSDALNNDYSVELTSDGSPTGIQQANFRFTRQAYKGSVWMKGSMPAGVTIELLDGEKVLGSAMLGSPTFGWAEYPFEIQSAGSTLNGSLRITASGAGSVKLDHVNMMGEDAIATGG